MKRIVLLPLFFFARHLSAQECEPADLEVALTGNNIQAYIQTNGVMFRNTGNSGLVAPAGSDIGSLYFDGFWLAGIDSSGEVRTTIQSYNLVFDTLFFPGILNVNHVLDSADCIHYHTFWQVTKNELLAALSDYNDNGIVKNPPASLRAWPAKGNPFFEGANGFALPAEKAMAPFFDRVGDGLYDPAKGDLPQPEATLPDIVLPAKLAWFVFNDFGLPEDDRFPVEVQLWCNFVFRSNGWRGWRFTIFPAGCCGRMQPMFLKQLTWI